MKTTMIALAALSTLLCTALTGCTVHISEEDVSKAADLAASVLDDTDISVNGQKVDVSVDSNGDINVSIAQTEVNQPAVVTEAPAVQMTEAAPAGLSEAEMKSISKQLIQEYVHIYDGLGSGSAKVDETQLREVREQWPYLMVIDPELQSIADVEQVLAKTLTGAEYAEMHALILEGDMPLFLPIDDDLYVRQAGRGGAYSDAWDWDGLKFTNVTAEGFTVTGQYVHMGVAPSTQSFDVINTPEGYRICKADEILCE